MGNSEIERELLSSFVIGGTIPDAYFSVLTPEDFSDFRNANLYSIMRQLQQEGKVVDQVTIYDVAQKKNMLEKVGGLDYFCSYCKAYVPDFKIPTLFETVMDYSKRRRLAALGRELEAKAGMDEQDIDILLETAAQQIQQTKSCGGKEAPDIRSLLDKQLDYLAYGAPEDISISTGYSCLNKLIGGLKPGGFYVLGARTGVGKTSFALNLALNACRNDGREKKKVLYVTLEMNEGEILYRAEAIYLGINGRKLQEYRLSEGEQDALVMGINVFSELGLNIKYEGMLGITDLTRLAYSVQRQQGLDFLIVDYLQLMHCPSQQKRYEEVAQISCGLKRLAGALNIPILALAQLNRTADTRGDKRPLLSDLRESGNIEQDADVVMLIHREDYYDKSPEKQGLAELNVAKNRNGATGVVDFFVDKGCYRYIEMM